MFRLGIFLVFLFLPACQSSPKATAPDRSPASSFKESIDDEDQLDIPRSEEEE